jgi:beta-glucosidase
VRNTGKVRGKEIVQLYVEDHTGAAPRPLRELKGFEKVDLGPGETRTVSFILDERAFDWYHPALGDWYAAPGEYTVAVGSSSRDIRLSVVMRLSMSVALPFQVDMDTTVQALLDDPRTREKARKDILDAFKGKDGITGGSSEGNALAAITAGDEWQRRGEVEMPLRHLYMIKGIPFPEVEKLVREFNELLGTAD